jgi:hypothetical protein
MKCSRQVFEKWSNIWLNEIPPSGSPFVPYGQAGIQMDGQINMTNLIATFRNFCERAYEYKGFKSVTSKPCWWTTTSSSLLRKYDHQTTALEGRFVGSLGRQSLLDVVEESFVPELCLLQCPCWKLKAGTLNILFNHQEHVSRKPCFRRHTFM